MHSPGHRLTAQSRQRTGQPDSIASDAKPLRCSIAAAHQAHALQNSLFSAVSDQQRVKFKLMQRATMLKPAHLFVVQVTTALWCRLQPLRCRLQPLFLKKAVVKSCRRSLHGQSPAGPNENERKANTPKSKGGGGGGVYSYTADTIEGPRAPAVKLTARHSSLTRVRAAPLCLRDTFYRKRTHSTGREHILQQPEQDWGASLCLRGQHPPLYAPVVREHIL